MCASVGGWHQAPTHLFSPAHAPRLQATGFLIFISVRVLLAGRTIVLTVAPMLGGLVRRGSSAQPGS